MSTPSLAVSSFVWLSQSMGSPRVSVSLSQATHSLRVAPLWPCVASLWPWQATCSPSEARSSPLACLSTGESHDILPLQSRCASFMSSIHVLYESVLTGCVKQPVSLGPSSIMAAPSHTKASRAPTEVWLAFCFLTQTLPLRRCFLILTSMYCASHFWFETSHGSLQTSNPSSVWGVESLPIINGYDTRHHTTHHKVGLTQQRGQCPASCPVSL